MYRIILANLLKCGILVPINDDTSLTAEDYGRYKLEKFHPIYFHYLPLLESNSIDLGDPCNHPIRVFTRHYTRINDDDEAFNNVKHT